MIETGLAVAAAAWGVLMGVSPVLQIRRMLRQRSSRDVSIGYFTILLIGFLLWISYGIAARNLALIVPNAVALLIGASTIAARTASRAAAWPKPRRRSTAARWPRSSTRGVARGANPPGASRGSARAAPARHRAATRWGAPRAGT